MVRGPRLVLGLQVVLCVNLVPDQIRSLNPNFSTCGRRGSDYNCMSLVGAYLNASKQSILVVKPICSKIT